MIAAALAAVAFAAAAVVAPLEDPAEERRAQALEREIRCVVCENEPISQSTAEMAVDMRALVREQIEAGASDGQVREYFRARYGDFVLFRPPLTPATFALWASPVLLLMLGLWLAARARRRPEGPLEPDFAADDR